MSIRKVKYKPVFQYGVITGVKRNAIVVEGPEPVLGFNDPKALKDYIKKNKVPVRTKPIYRKIPDVENLKTFCKDSKIDSKVNMANHLEGLRSEVIGVMEPAKTPEQEPIIQPENPMLN